MPAISWTVLNLMAWALGAMAVYNLRAEFDPRARTWFALSWGILSCLLMEAAMLGSAWLPGLGLVSALTGIASGVLMWMGFRCLQDDICSGESAVSGGLLDRLPAAFFLAATVAALWLGFRFPQAAGSLAGYGRHAAGAVWLAASAWIMVGMLARPCRTIQADVYTPYAISASFAFAFLHAAVEPFSRLNDLSLPAEVPLVLGTCFALSLVLTLYGMVIRVRSYKLAAALRELHDLQEKVFGLEKVAAVGTLAAGAAHDFNNAIAIVIGYVDAITAAELPEPLRGHFESVKKAAWGASTIAANLMGFARRQTGANPYTDLREAVLAPMGMLAKDFARHNIQFVSRVEGTPAVSADMGLVSHVCLNLYLNARDAMKSKGEGRLEVAVGLKGEEVEIAVSDTGTGIPEAFRSKIFQPFQSTKGDKGTGLGLSVSHSVVKSMGGSLSFETVEGLGTLFRVRLPVAAKAAATSPATGSIAIAESGAAYGATGGLPGTAPAIEAAGAAGGKA